MSKKGKKNQKKPADRGGSSAPAAPAPTQAPRAERDPDLPSLGHDFGLGLAAILLFVLSYHPWDLGWLAWFSLTPYFLLVERTSTRRLLMVLPVIALGQFLGGLHWIWLVTPPGLITTSCLWVIYLSITTFIWRGARRQLGLPLVVVGPILWVAVEFVRSYYTFYKFPWLLLGHSQHGFWPMLQTAELWGPYGISFTIALVSALLAQAIEMHRRDELATSAGRRRLGLHAVLPGIFFVGSVLFGLIRPHTIELVDGPQVALVQPSIPQYVKNEGHEGPSGRPTARQIFERHLILTGRALLAYPEADLVAWPETMVFWPPNERYPDYEGWHPQMLERHERELELAKAAKTPKLRAEHERWARASWNYYHWAMSSDRLLHEIAAGKLPEVLDALAKTRPPDDPLGKEAARLAKQLRPVLESHGHRGIDVIVGAVDQQDPEREHNSAFWIRRGGQPGGRYDKINLVPLSEYVPFKGEVGWLYALLKSFVPPEFVSFENGKGPVMFEVGDPNSEAGKTYKVSPHICFEVSFPELCRDQVVAGADIILSTSNDAWFRTSAELDLSRVHAIFRCVETRRGMARVVNAGITSIVDPLGRARDLVIDGRRKGERIGDRDERVEGILGGVVPTSRVETFSVRFGDVFGKLVLGLAIATAGFTVAIGLGQRLRGGGASSEETAG